MSLSSQIPYIVLLIVGLGVAFLLARRAVSAGTDVTLSREGFRDRRLFKNIVPWSAVTEVREGTASASRCIEIVTDLAFNATAERTWRYRFGAAFGIPAPSITTIQPAISSDRLLAVISAYREGALSSGPAVAAAQETVQRTASNSIPLRQRAPLATLSLMVVLSAVFAVEIMLAPLGESATTLTAKTLARYGGVGRNLVLDGQWWRLLTAPLLQSGPTQLILTLLALAIAGAPFERCIGWRWFLACFAGGALAGGAATCLSSDSTIVSCGSSGGISGLFAAMVLYAFAAQRGQTRLRLLGLSLGLLLPTLIPARVGLAHVDIAAYVGGAIGGLLTSVPLVFRRRRETRRTPQLSFELLAACAWVGFTILAVGLDAAAFVTSRNALIAGSSGEPSINVLGRLFAAARKGDASAEKTLERWGSTGSSVAATLLGNLYDPTFNKAKASVERTREAVRWYRIAADRNVPVAESDLGLLLVSARPGLAADPAEAARLFERAAPLDMTAARVLGILYMQGLGVPRDDARALALFENAAERGDLFAEKFLASVYDDGGLGIVRRPAEAVRMLRLAAMQGDATAERELAEHLVRGRGTTPAAEEAADWYARAAVQGDGDAQAFLLRSDPKAADKTPPWGNKPQVIGTTAGDDAAAERARCLEQRFKEPANRMASAFPSNFEVQKEQSAELVRSFGRDERVRYARAAAMYDADRDKIAEVDLQCAVDDQATWYTFPYEQPFILTLLARIKLNEGQVEEARRVVAPVCASGDPNIAALDLTSLCPSNSSVGPENH